MKNRGPAQFWPKSKFGPKKWGWGLGPRAGQKPQILAFTSGVFWGFWSNLAKNWIVIFGRLAFLFLGLFLAVTSGVFGHFWAIFGLRPKKVGTFAKSDTFCVKKRHHAIVPFLAILCFCPFLTKKPLVIFWPKSSRDGFFPFFLGIF